MRYELSDNISCILAVKEMITKLNSIDSVRLNKKCAYKVELWISMENEIKMYSVVKCGV